MQRRLKDIGVYGTVGLEFGGAVIVGLWFGQWLDKKFHTSPWLLLVGMGFGTAAGIRTLMRAAKRASKEFEDEDREESARRREYNDRYRKK